MKMDNIKKAFYVDSESSIKNRLKPCAESHRLPTQLNWWSNYFIYSVKNKPAAQAADADPS